HVAPPSLVRQTSLKIITKPKFSETKKMSRPKPFISVGIRPATAHVSPPFDVSQTSCSTVRTHPTKELRKKIFVSLALPNCSFRSDILLSAIKCKDSFSETTHTPLFDIVASEMPTEIFND